MLDSTQLLRYVFVGGSTAAVFAGSVVIVVEILGLDPILASIISCFVALYFNYFMHYHWTFRTEAPHGEVFAKYIAMCTVGFCINGIIMYLGTVNTNAHYLLIQTIAAGALVIWNFVASYLWVFNKSSA